MAQEGCPPELQLLTDSPSDPQDSPEGEKYDTLYCSLLAELKAAYPGHLPLLQEHLKKVRGGALGPRGEDDLQGRWREGLIRMRGGEGCKGS